VGIELGPTLGEALESALGTELGALTLGALLTLGACVLGLG
jgi:hypothetical protein